MRNTCIHCSVTGCKYQNENFCTLESVQIGTHEANPKMCECVDCESFVKAQG
jgi:hypothetical protein